MRCLVIARSAGCMALALVAVACHRDSDPNLIRASGHVEATEVRIASKVPGRLQSLKVREGDRVEAGQLLAEIDTTDAVLARAQAGAERDQAAADLRLRLAGARREDVAEAQAERQSADADLAGAERDLARMQGLLDKGSGTTKARDDARTRRDVMASRVEATGQVLARLKAGSRTEEIDAARARLAAGDARLAILAQQIADARLTSPVTGVVTEKVAEAGELLQVGSVVCVITDLTDPWLEVYVGEPDLSRVRLGQPAEVATDDGQLRTGRITFIASEAEFTPKNVQTRDERVKLVYKLKIGLDNKDGLFKPGMPAEARLRAAGVAP
jgi:HlyD family secretion protein